MTVPHQPKIRLNSLHWIDVGVNAFELSHDSIFNTSSCGLTKCSICHW